MVSFRHRQMPVQQEDSGLSRLRNEVKHPKGMTLTGLSPLATHVLRFAWAAQTYPLYFT
jgi:hypothetical protein